MTKNLRDNQLLTIGVLSFNTYKKLVKCINSLLIHLPDFNIFIWDNHSTDNTIRIIRENYPYVKLFENNYNLFFAEGCNQLLKKCKTKYVLLLNADVFLEDNSILEALSFINKDETLIAVSPSIKDGGFRRHGAHQIITPMLSIARDSFFGKIFKYTVWYHKSMLNHLHADEIFYAQKITNCCCIIRREEFIKIGGFNTKQLLYRTEEDFAIRCKKMGYKQAVYGKSTVSHEHGSSTATLNYSFLRAIFVHDRINYINKHYGSLKMIIVELLILLRPKIWNSIYDYFSFFKHHKKINTTLRKINCHRRNRR